MNLSPIQIKDKDLGKKGIKQIQQLAKEIKQIPTEEIEQYSSTNRDNLEARVLDQCRDDCEDSLLEELQKLTSRNVTQEHFNKQNSDTTDKQAMKNFMDAPFSRAISSINSSLREE